MVELKEIAQPKKKFLKVGMRQDNRLQECKDSEFKQSFPDVDYSFLGYNIFKGFPLAVDHDPGFTYPIFRANYSSGGQTADCRYSVPQGLVIIPDVSCVTSFASKTVQTKYEYSKELSISANISGGALGDSFSASAGYKYSSSQISSGESVFIISFAKCSYYFIKLITEKPPKFDAVFIEWIQKLNNTNANSEIYFDFFDTYGTHFLMEVTYGARYTLEHKMSSDTFESKREHGVNVGQEASYAGLFNVGRTFSFDASTREIATSFLKSVEIKTITVGAALPSNGDTSTWASEFKNSPIPTAYKLSSI
ncbi:perivitellin-2 67 kDa subunit-like [Mercenaria mercenaria]|uniref:perivitellin-2 67 kDa subunit-like n=1 Tax=Mercenaria mercenaria TaxID=6596 RepID=UPI00234EEC73|nr:perivitellin-2 67 kDa subunit-like [Mercenaria mercenaria]